MCTGKTRSQAKTGTFINIQLMCTVPKMCGFQMLRQLNHKQQKLYIAAMRTQKLSCEEKSKCLMLLKVNRYSSSHQLTNFAYH